MPDNEPKYTIGTAAKILGVSVHLLRVYEREGLILTYKTASGRRMYSELEIYKARCIRNMIQNDGLNFEGIRRLLALVPCWRLRGCTSEDRNACVVFASSVRPCWSSEEKCAHPLPSCRDCPVYQETWDCEKLKEIIFDMKTEAK